MSTSHQSAASPFRQPRAVWAVAFACVISFMGIGLVDPILPALSKQLDASASEVELLFTSYLVVTAVAMLFTGWVSSRIGAKRTLVAGLLLIVVFAAAAGCSPSIAGIVGFRAGWGLGNALFIATSLAVIVASASGGFAGAIILYETALGLGIAVGPLLGGELGGISYRGPFFGVSVLMAIALLATVVLVEPTPRPAAPTSLAAPLRALRHRGLLTMSLTAVLYNWGFFTLLGYSPFPMHLDAHRLGYVFTGWGVLVAVFSVLVAPRLQARFGTAKTLYANLAALALVMTAIGLGTSSQTTIVVAVIVAGAFIGINNTLTTQAVMTVSPVERPVASAAYGFVRFIGGGLAPFVAGKLAEHVNVHLPFFVGAATFAAAIGVLATGHRLLTEAERPRPAAVPAPRPLPLSPHLLTVGHVGPATSRPPVVVALEAGPRSRAVLASAVEIAALSGSPLDVVHVQETDVVDEVVVERESLEQARRAVAGHLDRLAASGVTATGHVLRSLGGHGDVGRVIARHARDAGARAIALGAPVHGTLSVLADASLSAALVREATCHVVLVRPRDEAAAPLLHPA